jgi:RNA polymerase sigma factor for flagellar operon FliA
MGEQSMLAAAVNGSLTVDYGARNDPGWQEQMVRQYAPLIKYIAARLSIRLPAHIHQEDLVSSGLIGLMDAIQKFDPSKNISFKTYAEFRIRGAMLDELRSLDWVPRSVRKKAHFLEQAYAKLERSLGRPAEAEEVARAMNLEMAEFHQLLDETRGISLVTLERHRRTKDGGVEGLEMELPEALQNENVRDSYLAVHFAQLQEIMVQAIEALPDKEKLLISLYYYEELTMKEIGQIMGYTESRVSQLHSQARLRLRHKLREYSQDLAES